MTNTRPSWDEVWMQVADTVALRSRCSRAQIGAVVVSKDQRVSSTGYNGPAASFPNEGECVNWCPRRKRSLLGLLTERSQLQRQSRAEFVSGLVIDDRDRGASVEQRFLQRERGGRE